jgi:hypothetical protein
MLNGGQYGIGFTAVDSVVATPDDFSWPLGGRSV